MRFILLTLVLFGFCDIEAQDLTVSTDSVYGEGSADQLMIGTETLEIINYSDTTYVVMVRQIESNRNALQWSRTLFTHYVTYPPWVDSISFELSNKDTGSLTFEFYPDFIAGCVVEKYEILSTGRSVQRDTVYVKACALNTMTVSDLKPRVLIYPNPTANELFFEINSGLPCKDFLVVNASGQLVQKGVLKQKTNRIDTGKLSDGNYLIWITGVENSVQFRVIHK